MSVGRALVDCAVLSLQDSCVFYPSCNECFARIEVDQQSVARCSRCGYWCLLEHVGYRYRLSLQVAKNRSIFGITVFGSTLNPFFGIDATGLHRLVQNTDGPLQPSVQLTLLQRAVEDCFIGRNFIFGMKLSETDSRPWLGSPRSKHAVQFIASQMVLPMAAGLSGCTVAAYYQRLLQKSSDESRRSADLGRSFRIPVTPLLPAPRPSQDSSFDASPSGFRLPLQSSQRTRQSECPLTPTPPWQQSPGVVTSSAEQDEGGATQGSGEESHRATDQEVPEKRPSVLPVEQSFSSHPSVDKPTNSSIRDLAMKSPFLKHCFTPSQAGNAVASTGRLSSPLSSTSFAWDDLPLSESLTAVLCDQNQEFDVHEIEPNLSVCSREETARKKVEMTNLTTGASPAAHRTAQQEKKSHSQMSLGDIDAPAADGCDRQDSSEQVCKDTRSPRFSLQSDGTQHVEKEEKDHERDSYNCSADLFNHSLLSDTSTEKLNNQTRTVETPSLRSDQNHPRKENVDGARSTLERQKNSPCEAGNRLPLQVFNFVPPSQSTPIVKVSVVSQSSTDEFSSRRDRTDCTKESLTWSSTPSRCPHRPSSGRRLWRADEHQSPQPPHQRLRVQRRRRRHPGFAQVHRIKRDSEVSQLTFCDYDEIELLPTPAAKTQPSVLYQRTRQAESCSSHHGQQGGGAYCHITTNSSHSGDGGGAADGRDIEIADDRILGRSDDRALVDESRTCDWSRDLFSDSV